MKLAKFTEKGIGEFRGLLERMRQGESFNSPLDVLTGPDLVEVVNDQYDFEVKRFSTRAELAACVDTVLVESGVAVDMNDIALWAWLAAAFLDSTCPAEANGTRKPGADYRHIPTTSWRDFYRHLIRGPVRIYRLFGDKHEAADIVMCQAPNRPGDFVEQLASRQERITNPAIIETANRLYFDKKAFQPKRGAAPNWRKAGTLRRFGDVLDQLDLTYDLYSMSADELMSLLPDEFSVYVPEKPKVPNP